MKSNILVWGGKNNKILKEKKITINSHDCRLYLVEVERSPFVGAYVIVPMFDDRERIGHAFNSQRKAEKALENVYRRTRQAIDEFRQGQLLKDYLIHTFTCA